MVRLLMILVMTAGNANAFTVPEALSHATGWPMPGQDGTWMAQEYERGRAPGGYHHGSGLGYVQRDRTDEKPLNPGCPPHVPVPGAFWLFASAVAGISVIGRRK